MWQHLPEVTMEKVWENKFQLEMFKTESNKYFQLHFSFLKTWKFKMI